ncbi:MAG: hypothetical protein EA386_07225 [Rhodobacteraceae bacterium]|nr:MAG: hypothetical protein EA386_07225 [Paracoccaceae bacterium]
MSNPDSFFNEVTEELRRDRMIRYMRRYGWIAVLLVVLIVGGAAWNEWRKANERASAEAFGDSVLAAMEQGDPSDRLRALGEIETTGAQSGLLQLLSAGELLDTDRDAALSALEAAANDSDLPDAYRQLAALKRVIAGGTTLPMDEREGVIAGLSQPGQPLRPLALEQSALLQLEQGNRDAAIEILTDMLSESGVSDSLRRRASQLVVALGGEV